MAEENVRVKIPFSTHKTTPLSLPVKSKKKYWDTVLFKLYLKQQKEKLNGSF